MPQNLKSAPLSVKRRRFITHSIVGGVAAAAVGTPVFAQTDGNCGPISKSDWLVSGLALLSHITTEAYESIVTVISAQLASYKSAFNELHCLLTALSAEIAKTERSSQAIHHMQTLVEVGLTNGGLVKAALRQGEDPAPLFAALGLLSQEICTQAQNIPPAETQMTLSKEASGILKKILDLTASEKFVTLHKGIESARVTDVSQRESVNKLISAVSRAITSARNAILLAENPFPKDEQGKLIIVDKTEQLKKADDSLAQALVDLNSLVNDKRVSTVLPEDFRTKLPEVVLSQNDVATALTKAVNERGNDPLPSTDILILGLGTVRRELDVVRRSTAVSEGFRFVRASYSTTAAPVVDRNAMANALWNHCPPGSREQIDRVDSIVSFVGGWSIWLPRDVRAQLIAGALWWANKAYRLTCSGTRDLRALANVLANMV